MCWAFSAAVSCSVSSARRKLELPAGLERDVGLAALERDRVVALDHGLPAEARQASSMARIPPAVIGQGLQRLPVKAELLVLGAHAPGGLGLLPAAKYSISCRRFSIGVPPPDGGADIR